MNVKTSAAAAALSLLVMAAPGAMAFSTKGTNQGWSKKQRGEFDRKFAQFDRNRDGAITRDEFPGDAALFQRLDLNRDGAVTRAEVQQALPNRGALEQQARAYDRNGDGVITRNEFPGNDTAFSRLDRNGDGVLSQADRDGRGKGKAKGQAKRQHRDDD